MTIDSIAALGQLGIQKGVQGVRTSASQIASAGTTTDMTAALVALKPQELQVAASAKVIEAADDMLGALLDTFA
ncbi:MAG: hypothetical protein K8I04_15705 [Gammaproteobacteria bacterium]|nr:hypothetical protein [Gammaproteobacteria bacterium]